MSVMNKQIYRITLCVAMLYLGGCHDDTQAPSSRHQSPPGYAVRSADYASFPITDTYPGTVVADDSVTISSRVVGFIRNLAVREGQHISVGEPLLSIDPRDTEAAIRQAEAELAAARQTQRDAGIDVEKLAVLSRTGAISTEQYRKARVNRDISQAAVNKAEAALEAARAARSYTDIISPVDGVVTQRFVRSGEMTTTGAQLLTIESRKLLLFRIYVPESRVPMLKTHMPVDIHVDALGARYFHGKILDIVPSGDTVTRRYQVNIALNDDPALYPGMFGRAALTMGNERVLAVSQQSLVTRGGLEGVFSVDETQHARFHWLRTGQRWNEMTEITAGLTAGEQVILQPNDRLKDGMLVMMQGNINER